LWVSGEVYDPLHNVHRRQEREEAAQKRGHAAEKRTEEVKIPAQKKGRGDPKVADEHGCFARTRLGSLKVTDCASELGLPFQEGRSEEWQRLWLEKTDPIMHRATTV
jgi:hypothetical protein